MIGIHVAFTIPPASVETFLEWKTAEGALQRQTLGFSRRSLHRCVEQPNVFYYVSYWETQEQMETFGSSEWFKAAGASLNRAPDDATVTLVHITEVFDERPDLQPAARRPSKSGV